MLRVINVFCLFVLIISLSFSQKNEKLDRSKPPKISKPDKISFPKYREKQLSNGLQLVVIENHFQPTVFVSVTVKAGSYFDADKPGVSSLVSELLTKGTKTKNALQIAREIDFLGAELNSNSNWDANRLSLKILKKNFEKGLDLFTECLLSPTFPEEELKREITQRLAALQHEKTDPNFLAEKYFSKVIYKNLPYANSTIGDESSLEKISVNDLKEYYSKFFQPSNAFCVVVGDITLEEIEPILENKFASWKNISNISKEYKKFEIDNNRKVVIIDKKDAVQSSIRIGCISIDRTSPDFFIASVLNTYLGGYFRSQLNLNLREKNSYTYGASSGFDARMLNGPFVVRTEVGSEVTAPAVNEILKEIDALSKKDIPKDRFEEVKNFIVGSFPIGIQTPSQIAAAVSVIKLYNLPSNYYDNYVANIHSVTKDDIKKFAKKYLDISKLSIVISGDSKLIKDSLSKFGNVQILDADGNKVN